MGIGNGIVIKIGSDVKDAIAGINRVEGALGRSLTAGEKWNSMSGRLRVSALAAAAAAGAFAVKLGVDAVQAAAEDEKALASLNRTLENLGFGYATQEVDGFIGRLQFATGVSDAELRPAFDRLVRSTRDVGDAERALQIAVDASANGQRSVLEVANALGKAYDGNTTALGRLGLGIDQTILRSGDLDAILNQVADTFDGQAATAASTLQGRLNRVSEAAAEASEQIGYELLDSLELAVGGFGGKDDGLIGAIDDGADAVQRIIRGLGLAAEEARNLAGASDDSANGIDDNINSAREAARVFIPFYNVVEGVVFRYLDMADAAILAEAAVDRSGNAAAVAGQRYAGLAASIAAANAAQNATAVGSRYTALAVQAYGASIRYAGGNLADWRASLTATNRELGGGGGGGGGTAGALDRVNPRIEKQTALIRKHIDALEAQAQKLDDARQSLDRYSEGIASTLTGGIDLQDAWEQQLDQEATIRDLDKALADAIAAGDAEGIAKAQAERSAAGTAQSWIDAYIRQIEDTVAFSGALANLGQQLPKTPGAQLLIDQLAGLGALGGTGLLEGLGIEQAGDLAAKLDSALTAAGGSGGLLAEHFYGEGVAAAEKALLGMTEQIAREEDKLIAIGRRIGQPIGAEIRAEIAAAVASALTGTEYQATIENVVRGIADIAGNTYQFTGPVIDPVNVSRALRTAEAQARARTGGGP
jgi:hypothetical protein